MNLAHIAVLVLGVVVLLVTAAGVIRVLIVPRPPARGLSVASMRMVRWVFRKVAYLARDYDTKDRILVLSEPIALIFLLASWLMLTAFGFTLVNWGLDHGSFSQAFDEAGSSVFTLGFTLSHQTGSQAIDFVAAGSGMVLVALQIAYLPALYSSFNRRETLVTLLESRAGAPAWGPELLIRHHLVGMAESLRPLYAEWERWAADVTESHTSYPSLLYMRSPRSKNSWIISLIATLDAAAMQLALDPEGAPTEARMCIRMGFTCLRDIAQVTGISYQPDPSPDDAISLPKSEFDAAAMRLEEIGFPMSRTIEEAWPHFRGWRVNYETVAYALASSIDAPPARWSGPRHLFRGESLEPSRPVDRQPGGGPAGPQTWYRGNHGAKSAAVSTAESTPGAESEATSVTKPRMDTPSTEATPEITPRSTE